VGAVEGHILKLAEIHGLTGYYSHCNTLQHTATPEFTQHDTSVLGAPQIQQIRGRRFLFAISIHSLFAQTCLFAFFDTEMGLKRSLNFRKSQHATFCTVYTYVYV